MTDPRTLRFEKKEAELFQREFSDFVPRNSFDAHAHLYDFAHLSSQSTPAPVGIETYHNQQQFWMGELAPQNGLFFPFPKRGLDTKAANTFLHQQIASQLQSRGLMMVSPEDNPAAVEAEVEARGWAGFKVYHLFASREDTTDAEIGEYLPEWAWEIAYRHRLAIMLHMVKPRALADAENQKYIRSFCRKYSDAKLILAHAARGFCAHHTVEGLPSISDLDNVFFDNSAICESLALEAILKTYGPTRLLYGSDFPVSDARGRCVSLGDGFHWIYETDQEEWSQGKPILIGLESLRALKQACENLSLNESDIELIFKINAHQLLGIEEPPEYSRDEQQLYREAKQLIPGGTQLLSKRPEMYAPDVWPPYFREARGCEITTLDGHKLIDFTTNGIGSCLLGFNHPEVSQAVQRRVRQGAMSTLNPPEEVELARRLVDLHPWADQVRFARAGGEALAVAVRIARAATDREVVAFCGYHGWNDWYLAANISGGDALTSHLLPGLSPDGVPRSLGGTTLPFSYNKLDELERIVRERGQELAAVVMEPTRNAPPVAGFLEGVRELCDKAGARLIFDEVTSGFRLHRVGAHLLYGIEPDAAVYAKALGNGHPIAAVVGRRSTLEAAETSFISSTYWTESIGPTAALATLEVLAREDVPAHIASIGQQMRDGLASLATQFNIPLKVGGYPALTTLGFEHPESAALVTLWTTRMLDHGFLAGGGFYPTLAHNAEHVEQFLQAAQSVFEELSEAIEKQDVVSRLKGPVKHGGFARLN